MAVYADRVKETTTTTGTGTYSLAGAETGFQSFVIGVGTSSVVTYVCEDGTNWEVGEGTVTDGTPDTLSRTSILASSNAGAAVNWGAGTKNVFLTLPANRLVTIDKANSFATRQYFTQGTEALPSIGFSGDANTGLSNVVADTVGISTGGKYSLVVGGTAGAQHLNVNHGSGYTDLELVATTGTSSLDITSYGPDTAGGVGLYAYATAGYRALFKAKPIATITGAQNYVHVFSNNPGGTPTIEAEGGDTNISLGIWTKGTGTIQLNGTSTTFSSTGALSSSLTISSTRGFASAEYNQGNSSTAVTVNWNNGQNQKVTMTGNATITLSTPVAGSTYKLKLIQDATGSRTATFSPTPLWAGGVAPTLSTSANAVDIVTLYYDGTSYYGIAATNFA